MVGGGRTQKDVCRVGRMKIMNMARWTGPVCKVTCGGERANRSGIWQRKTFEVPRWASEQ